MKNIRESSFGRRRTGWAVAALVACATIVTGCDLKQELLAPQQPAILGPGDIAAAGAPGAEALRVGALGGLQAWVGGGNVNQENTLMLADLLTDVWKSGDTFLERNETDQRAISATNGVWSSAYTTMHRARGFARDAATALAAAIPTQPGEQAEMWFIMGETEMQISQIFCNGTPFSIVVGGVPQYAAGITNAAGFALAITHLDSAIALSGGTDSVAPRVKSAALIAKAQALVDLGQFAAAAALVPAIPTSYTYAATFSQPTTSNEIWSLNASQSSARYVVGDSFDLKGQIANAIPFASAGDPRVTVSGTTLDTLHTAIDKATPWVGAMWKDRSNGVIIASGLDARLIEAEAKLNAADFNGMTAILNALRAAPPVLVPGPGAAVAVMPALVAPTDAAVATDLFFREKAFWQFGRGQRLSDLRRLIRQYHRDPATVFPTGVFHKGGTYSNDVNAPLPNSEKNSNPKSTGCFDRNA